MRALLVIADRRAVRKRVFACVCRRRRAGLSLPGEPERNALDGDGGTRMQTRAYAQHGDLQ